MRSGHGRVIAGVLLLTSEVWAQTTDWPKVLHDLVNKEDPVTKAAAGKLTSETLLPTLQGESATSLEQDVRAIAKELNDSSPDVRVQASAVLYTLTAVRGDTAVTLRDVLPLLVAHFQDPTARVRANVVRTVASLRPDIPPDGVRGLVSTMRDRDQVVRELSIYGIARVASQSSDALRALQDLLDDVAVPIRIEALRAVGFAKVQAPPIIDRLRQMLADKDPAVVKATVEALDNLGPAAAPALPELEKIVDGDRSDKDLVRAAAAVIAKIDNH